MKRVKGALSGLRQFSATESPLKMMKNAFYFSSKFFSFSRYLTFYLDFFGPVAKQLDQKGKVNLKIYDVTDWLTNNCNTHIAQYLEK